MKNSENNNGRTNERFPGRISFLRYMLRGSFIFFAMSMVFSAAVSLIDLVSPKIISCVADYILGNEPLPASGAEKNVIEFLGGREHIRENLYIPALCVLSAAAAGALARYFQGLTNSIGAERFMMRLRNSLFTHIDKLPLSWYGENSTGDILQRCTSDAETVKQFVSVQLTSLFRTVVMITFSLSYMIRISPRLTLASGIFIPIIVGYSMYFHSKIGEAFMRADTEEGAVSSIVQENLTGMRVIRAFGKEAFECDRFRRKNAGYTDLWIRLMKLMSIFWSLGDIFSGLQVMAAAVCGAVLCAENDITVGNYIAFISCNSMLIWPVRELGRTIADLSRAGVASDRIRYILNSETEDLYSGDMPSVSENAPIIRARGVSFSYIGGADVLKDISFEINRGEKIGIIGSTGSGKSTLADIIMRMDDSADVRGSIEFMGRDIREYPLSEYRKMFSRVLQEPFLFSGSIAYNIGAACDSLSTEKMKQAADDSALTQAVEKFTGGFDTFVGERGVTLSGGQKQRCAAAAALAKEDAEVYIFDDAFSALDAETESIVRKNIYKRLADKTMIVISHRISTISGCDRIYVLDGGRIAASGSHSELISAEGIYRDIYELQSGK